MYTNEHRSAIAVSFSSGPGPHCSDEGPLDELPWDTSRIQLEDRSTLPALQRFIVTRYNYDPGYGNGRFDVVEMLCQYSVSLVVLSLERVPIRTNELCSMLLHSSKLTDLALLYCGKLSLDDVFKFLTVPSGTPEIICPVLQRLRLDHSDIPNVQPFVEMVSSRWQYAKIKGMGLSLSGYVQKKGFFVSDGQRQQVEHCISEGLDYDMRWLLGQ